MYATVNMTKPAVSESVSGKVAKSILSPNGIFEAAAGSDFVAGVDTAVASDGLATDMLTMFAKFP